MRITAVPGDGIGPEVIREALRVLAFFGERTLKVDVAHAGRTAHDVTGHVLPSSTERLVLDSDAILLGAIGDNTPRDYKDGLRPETALLKLRRMMGCSINLRPIICTALPPHARCGYAAGADILIVRELHGCAYYGRPRGTRLVHTPGAVVPEGFDTMRYSDAEVRCVARFALEAARHRRGMVLSVDKANVLSTSRLWRDSVTTVAQEYADVRLAHCYVDSASVDIMTRPHEFDVVLTGNLFGDILSDQLSILPGSLGMLPSASVGNQGRGLYEPVHGSAPAIAGLGVACPIAAILSLSMLLRHALGWHAEASLVEAAVERVARAVSAPGASCDGTSGASTSEVGDAILAALRDLSCKS
ncbi:3-isopropylmalate dehydrogenase [Candidatus Tremblaya princeps]|uniref:3-isopropylmalate dehydrogenase n=1 Tax=Tremblaya princeps TaxID=189385 RepID=A0A143WN83_TREPR|nr:3-isopropylmalate dehydrogenase [Candidatus Tremblaya princeps]